MQLCEPLVFGGPARNARVNCSVAISGAREFTSCPSSDVAPPTVLAISVPSLVEIQTHCDSKFIRGQSKFGCNTPVATTALLLYQNSLTSNLRVSNSTNFLGKHAPRPPHPHPFLPPSCSFMLTHGTRLCSAPSENLRYLQNPETKY